MNQPGRFWTSIRLNGLQASPGLPLAPMTGITFPEENPPMAGFFMAATR
jgi:hypothetical protein